jgi:hypothetical protein
MLLQEVISKNKIRKVNGGRLSTSPLSLAIILDGHLMVSVKVCQRCTSTLVCTIYVAKDICFT